MKVAISWDAIVVKIESPVQLAHNPIFQKQNITEPVDAYLIANVHKIRLFHHPKKTITRKTKIVDPHSTCTYIAYNPCTGLTKIGRSTNHDSRIECLQRLKKTDLKVIKIINGDHEKILHYRYHSLLINNEWFNLNKKHYKEIREYAKKNG